MIETRYVRLEAMRVARYRGFGEEPEGLAWAGLAAWLEDKGVRIPEEAGSNEPPAPGEGQGGMRFFGFNNPNPSPASPNYGYEQWTTLEGGLAGLPDGPAGRGVEIGRFEGGSFLVARHRGSPERLPGTWAALMAAAEAGPRRPVNRQWLEECLSPGLVAAGDPSTMENWAFDLYLPVEDE